MCAQLWRYLAEFFLEFEMFQTEVVAKIKTHILCSASLFRKFCNLWDDLETCYNDTVMDDIVIWRVHFACWITKATDTHSELYLRHCHGNVGYSNARHCYLLCVSCYFYVCLRMKVVYSLKGRKSSVGIPDIVIWHVHFACWITKATETHSE